MKIEPFEMCSQLASTMKDAEECGWFLFPSNTVDHSEIKGKVDYYEHPLPTSRFVLFGETPEGEVHGFKLEDDEEYRYVTKLLPGRKPTRMFKFDLNACRAQRQLVFKVYGKGPTGTGWQRKYLPELENEAGALAPILNAFFHAFRTTGTVVSYRGTGKANNAKRIKRGQAPVFSWNTITLHRREIMKAEHQGGTHASPCLHERCGHWRTYKKSGKKVWIKPTMVGSIENGRRSHMYTFKEAR